MTTVPDRPPGYGFPTERSSGAPGGFLPTVLLVSYLVAKPFYLFSSGNPQPADAVIGLAFLWAGFSSLQLAGARRGIFFSIILFCIYAFFINGILGVLLNDISILKTPIFYAFNALIVYVVFVAHEKLGERALRILVAGVIISLCVQFVLAIFFSGYTVSTTGRNDLFFNNPNQLGYWALLSASLLTVLSRATKVNGFLQIAAFALAFYLVALSLGKAATASMGLLFLIHFTKRWWHFLLAVMVAGIGYAVMQDQDVLLNLANRMSDIGSQSDDSVLGRGYARIWNHPEYLLLGAGEWGLQRFPGETHELHSTLGTVFFSYGIVGFTLFCVILWRLFKHAGLANFLYLAPAFAYGLTHQGLRFSLLWVLFAALAITGRQRKAEPLPRGPNREATPQDS